MTAGRWVGALGMAFLAAAVAVQFWPRRPMLAQSSMARGEALANSLPLAIAGTAGRDEPIAATEEMKRAVAEALNFDDAIFRIYELPGIRVSVYAAWWRPGKMSPRLVGTHTPDVCWPANGWRRDINAESAVATLPGKLDEGGFLPAECRVFDASSRKEHVVFWHKVGPEVRSYANGWAPPWWASLDEMRRNGLNLRQEQLFVRVSSDRPIEEVLKRPEFSSLRQALLELGLRRSEES